MQNAPAPNANQVVISRDMDFKGYYDDSYRLEGTTELKVPNLHDINWPNTHNNESTDISSFQLGKDVVIEVFSDYNFQGQSQKFERSERDLRDKQMPAGDDDWNNEIKSFIVYRN